MKNLRINSVKTKKIEWNSEKNELLKENRDVCFEDIENAINDNRVLDILPHPNQEKYPHQRILVVKINNYVHYVPFVEDEEKSIIPSRKHNSKYL
jgi:uncharacterized DUF497 family protein